MSSKAPAELIEAKLILLHGIFHINRERPSRIDRHFAVHHAHHAIELLLRKKAADLGANPSDVYDFPRLKKFLKGKGVRLTYEREIDALNTTRDLVQHYGQVPDEREAYNLVHTSESFAKDFCADSFGVDYTKISSLENIENDDIRKTMQEAQEAFDQHRFDDAAVTADLAIQKAKWIILKKTQPEGYGNLSLSREVREAGLEHTISAIENRMNRLFDVALSATFAADLKRLSGITCAGFLPIPGGKPTIQIFKQARNHEPSSDDAKFALELAMDYVLWAEQAHGLKE